MRKQYVYLLAFLVLPNIKIGTNIAYNLNSKK